MQNECLNSRGSSTNTWFSLGGLSAEKNAATVWGKDLKRCDCITHKCFDFIQHWKLPPYLLILALNLEAQWNCAYSSVREACQSPGFERPDLNRFKLDQKRRVNFCGFLYITRKWCFIRRRWMKLLHIYHYISASIWNPSMLYVWFSDVKCMMKWGIDCYHDCRRCKLLCIEQLEIDSLFFGVKLWMLFYWVAFKIAAEWSSG